MRTTRRLFNIFFLIFAAVSCVSVEVPFGPVLKSGKTSVKKPAAPFEEFATSTADEAWINDKTGNTISYLSECKKTKEKTEEIATEAAEGIDYAKILKSSKGKIDGHPTTDLLVSGKIDSKKVRMAISVFKIGDCTFSLTYGGREEQFDSELPIFEEFKEGFKAK